MEEGGGGWRRDTFFIDGDEGDKSSRQGRLSLLPVGPQCQNPGWVRRNIFSLHSVSHFNLPG